MFLPVIIQKTTFICITNKTNQIHVHVHVHTYEVTSLDNLNKRLYIGAFKDFLSLFRILYSSG